MKTIWFMGDPHGDFRRVRHLALERKPDLIVFLGDLELPAPYEEVFLPLIRTGTLLRAVHGNHDADDEDLWRRMHDGVLAERFNLDGRVEDFDGVRIAGLGGLFRSRIWQPPGEPNFRSYADFERGMTPRNFPTLHESSKARFRKSELLTHRASIFPDDYERLARSGAAILVTHEAPGGAGFHRYGSPAITELATKMKVRRAFCGHHHECIRYPEYRGCEWTMVDTHQIVDQDGVEVY